MAQTQQMNYATGNFQSQGFPGTQAPVNPDARFMTNYQPGLVLSKQTTTGAITVCLTFECICIRFAKDGDAEGYTD